MASPGWPFTPGDLFIALAISAWSVWTISLAVRRRPAESLVDRCRNCKYPVPTAGPADRCPECGKSLRGDGTLPATEDPKPPPGRVRIFLACMFAAVMLASLADAPINVLCPAVPSLQTTSHTRYSTHIRPGSQTPSYSVTLDMERIGPSSGPPDSGTLVLAFVGDSPSLPQATFDLRTGRLLRSKGLSPAPDPTSTMRDVVEAMYESADLRLADADRKAHADSLARIASARLQSFSHSGGGLPTVTEPEDVVFFNSSGFSSCSTVETYRMVLGRRINRRIFDLAPLSLEILLIIFLYRFVARRARNSRVAEWEAARARRAAAATPTSPTPTQPHNSDPPNLPPKAHAPRSPPT
jgi:hypothetical protein